MGILLPLRHSSAQTLPTTTDEPDVTLCQAGQKVVLGNCSDAKSYTWSPTTGLTPDADPKKAQITVSPTETTVYTRTATRNTPSGVVKETWKVRVVVVSASQIEKFLIDEGFIGFPCTIPQRPVFRDTIQVEERGSSDIVDYAKLEVTIERQKMDLKNIISLAAQDIPYSVRAIITKKATFCEGIFMKEYNNFNSGIFIYIVEDNANSKLYVKVKSMNEDELEGFEGVVARILRGGLKYSTRYYSSDNKHLVEYPHPGLQNAICIIRKEKLQEFWNLHGLLKSQNNFLTDLDNNNIKLRRIGLAYEESEMDDIEKMKTSVSCTSKQTASCNPTLVEVDGKKVIKSTTKVWYTIPTNDPRLKIPVNNVIYGEYGSYFRRNSDGLYKIAVKSYFSNTPFQVTSEAPSGNYALFHTHPNKLPFIFTHHTEECASKNCSDCAPESANNYLTQCASAGASLPDFNQYRSNSDGNYNVVSEIGYYFFYNRSEPDVKIPLRRTLNQIKLKRKLQCSE
jgi:hypothetical protein